MNTDLMQQDLAALKTLCQRVHDRHRNNTYDLTRTAFNGLEFEEVLGSIIDEYIPAAMTAARQAA